MRWSEAEAMAHRLMVEFTTAERREWTIYGARTQVCPKCDAAIGTSCMDLNKRRRGIEAEVKNPHAERIDWQRVVDALTGLGYTVAEPAAPIESSLDAMPDWAR